MILEIVVGLALLNGGFVLGWLVCNAGRREAEITQYLEGFDLGRNWHEVLKEPGAVPEVFRKAFPK